MKKVKVNLKKFILPFILFGVSFVFILFYFSETFSEVVRNLFMSLGTGLISSGIISLIIDYKAVLKLRHDDESLFSSQKNKTEEFLSKNYLFFYNNIDSKINKQVSNSELDNILNDLYFSGLININLISGYKKQFEVYFKNLDNYVLKSKNVVDIKSKIQPLRDDILFLVKNLEDINSISTQKKLLLKYTKEIYFVMKDMFRSFNIETTMFMEY